MAYFSLQTSAWILTLICIDRYLILTNSNWKRRFSKNIKMTIFIILSLIIGVAVINLPVAFLNGKINTYSVTSPSGNITLVTEIDCYTTIYMKFWEKFMLCNECLIPLILMIVFNSLLIYKTHKSSVKLKIMQQNEHKRQLLNNNKSETQVTSPKTNEKFFNISVKPKRTDSFDFTKNATTTNKLSVSEIDLNSNTLLKAASKTCLRRSSTSNILHHTYGAPLNINYNENDNKLVFLSAKQIRNANSSIMEAQKAQAGKLNNDFLIELSNIIKKNKENFKFSNRIDTKKREKIINNTKHSQRRNRRIVIMLILLTASFAISTFPSTMFYSFLRPFLNNKPYKRLLTLIFTLLRHLSHSFNFLIYFKYSSMIKQELNTIVKFKKLKYLVRVNCFNFIQYWCAKCCFCCVICNLSSDKLPNRFKVRNNRNDVKTQNASRLINSDNCMKSTVNNKIGNGEIILNNHKSNDNISVIEKNEESKQLTRQEAEFDNSTKIDNPSFEESMDNHKSTSLSDKNNESSEIKKNSPKKKWKFVLYAINATNVKKN